MSGYFGAMLISIVNLDVPNKTEKIQTFILLLINSFVKQQKIYDSRKIPLKSELMPISYVQSNCEKKAIVIKIPLNVNKSTTILLVIKQ